MTDDLYKREYYHLRSFEDLLYDAVMLSYMTHDIDFNSDEHGYQFALIRASIIDSILLLECAANCCISSLGLSGQFLNDIDKLPFPSKFEYFLKQFQPKVKFDRGCKEIQCIVELKTIRDSYVHPKVKKEKMVQISESAWEANFGKTKMLDIPRATKDWRSSHTVDVLKATNAFLNRYFLEWCKFDTNTICHVLLGSEEAHIPDCIGKTGGYGIDCIGTLDRAVTEWGIDFKYLGKRLQ